MAIQFLDLSGFEAAIQAVDNTISGFNNALTKMQVTTDYILLNWMGDGAEQFSTQVSLINSKLKDVSEELYDIYNSLVQAEKTYIDADQAVAKEISIQGESRKASDSGSKGQDGNFGGGGGGGRI